MQTQSRTAALFSRATLCVAGALTLSSCGGDRQDGAERTGADPEGPVALAGADIDYNWDVRPLLSQNCFACHGNDAANREAGLRLDVPEGAFGELPESPGLHAIVPGQPDQSELIRRITATDPDVRMPPPERHTILSDEDVDTLTRWIEAGAEYKDHWAYIPPARQQPAPSRFDDRAVNPIDGFVFAQLEEEGLAPAPEADRETLINRVHLTLTGLPPSLEAVDAFLADDRPDAYERIVDELLASPAYAERMAQTWMDVARYADTDGYLNDGGGRLLYPYRDWVISAFQRNLPYDEFATWQLAGDLLDDATTEQVLATSFLRQGKRNAEGGITDEEWRVEYVNERTELIGSAFLGLTVGCAKCHDHKYDVISQADYYSVAGFFNNMDEGGVHASGPGGAPMGPALAWATPEQSAALEQARAETSAAREALIATLAELRDAHADEAAALARTAQDGETGALGNMLTASLAGALQAYYPLDETYIASFEPLMIGPDDSFEADPAEEADEAEAEAAAAPVQFEPAERRAGDDLSRALSRAVEEGRYTPVGFSEITTRRLLVGLDEAQIAWTPSGREGDRPGAINNAHMVEGARGQAVEIYDTIGFADSAVGMFDRFDPFTLDMWVKIREGEPYAKASILYNSGFRGGYDLYLEDNRLKFDIAAIAPYNMISVRTEQPLAAGVWTHITATYDGSSQAAGLKLYVDGELQPVEIYRDRLTRSSMPRGGHSLLGSYYGLAFGTRRGQEEFKDSAIDEIRVFERALNPAEVAYLHAPEMIGEIGADTLTDQIATLLADRNADGDAARDALNVARNAEAEIEVTIPQLMIAADAPVARPNYVLDRGVYDQYLEPTPAGVPEQVFAGGGGETQTRLDLAHWLFDENNPLTARVYVNRLWQLHFGTGLVKTVQDFGTQGENPSNPALLDWLAVEFRESGWDIAHLHRLIVMSATYRQSSNVDAALAERDPENRLLARGPRYRLPAEMIRDGALFASGLLDQTVGGDAVFPYQPPNVWKGNGLGANIYPLPDDVPASQHHRRSMYTYVKRTAMAPSMLIFDAADRNVTSVSRTISNTPLQALVLMNDPQFMEAYRKIAERAMLETGDAAGQVETVFRLATRRRPLPAEAEALERYRVSELERFRAAPDDVAELLGIGVTPADVTVDSAELAALTMVASAAMNSPDAYMLR